MAQNDADEDSTSEVGEDDLCDSEDNSEALTISSDDGENDSEGEDDDSEGECGHEETAVEVVKEKKDDITSHPFTIDEDGCLKKGLLEHGWGKWLKILGERNYRFHPYRSGECLQKRAEKLQLDKQKVKKGGDK